MRAGASLLLAAAMVLVPCAHAAGEASSCGPDKAAVEAPARASTGDLFTRPEETVPAAKRTRRGLYLTAQDAHDMFRAMPDKVLFVDVRTRGELQFIGMPTLVDASVPFLVEASPLKWDEASSSFQLVQNARFVETVDRRLAEKGLSRQDVVILLCQGGVRAARAADTLTQAGYSSVYTTIDGFEGDPLSDGPHKGERLMNGWRNAGLPWTTRLDRSKMDGVD